METPRVGLGQLLLALDRTMVTLVDAPSGLDLAVASLALVDADDIKLGVAVGADNADAFFLAIGPPWVVTMSRSWARVSWRASGSAGQRQGYTQDRATRSGLTWRQSPMGSKATGDGLIASRAWNHTERSCHWCHNLCTILHGHQ